MICTKCKRETPLEKMGKNKNSKNGYNIYCLDCIRELSRLYRVSNKEKCRLSSKNWTKKNIKKVKEKNLKRYYLKSEEIRKKCADYRKLNHERRLEIERSSRLRNKEKNRPSKNARQGIRNRKLANTPYLILEKELRKIYNSPCFMCGCEENQSLDHIIPISRGGSHSVGNIMTLCKNCNASKNARTITEWKHSKDMLGVG